MIVAAPSAPAADAVAVAADADSEPANATVYKSVVAVIPLSVSPPEQEKHS